MFLYPWDVRDEGADRVGARLAAAGISSVAVATSYHAGKFLRPHAPNGRVWYPEDGTVYFRPDPSLYGRLKPRVAQVAEDFDALSALARAAPALARAGWTVGLHNSRLGRAHPDLVCRTAFGDPIRSALCPAQPEVRDYLAALCLDQARNCPVEEISIEAPGYQAYRHNDHHEFELIELTPRAASLLGLCFCPACLAGARSAGIDAAGLAAQARSQLEQFFADGTEGPDDLADDPVWQPFLDWRARVVAELMARIRAELPAGVSLSVIPTVRSPLSLCWREGSDLARLAAAADRLAIPLYCAGAEATGREARAARAAAGPEARLSFILRPSWPTIRSAEELAAVLEAVTGAEAHSIEYYNYGHIRLQSLDWIGRQVH
ncbi:hypothetical protein AAFN88_18840 [Pelagibius sp. CAU 1746]|uniref:hypothetical protein n=1 Tax=Pelagibius sp. CAU 1746 TaxID=3140370 RepID=UPI00325B4496